MMGRPQALVLLNPRARHGRAFALWRGVEEEVRRRFDLSVATVEEGEAAVLDALGSGGTFFIAAGGDGTIHTLVNALLKGNAPAPGCVLGAVGLGSSNDFHKPFGRTINGLPVRLDVGRASPRDLGLATFSSSSGRANTRAFLVSASIGACAAANQEFNRGGQFQSFVQKHSVQAAIAVAGLRSLFQHRCLAATLTIEGEERRTRLANLSVSKTPHLAGKFTYDTPVSTADGLFAANLCEDMSRTELARTMAALARGRFSGRPKTHCRSAASVSVELEADEPLELDGEIYTARAVDFAVLPRALRVCG